jgi:branched-chain amino acid:cation transporter, LIVCS family
VRYYIINTVRHNFLYTKVFMEVSISRVSILTAGLAIFAMQFGAGNIVFALGIGHFAQDKALLGSLGLIISAVLVPLLGLIAMTLFNGDYKAFFSCLGRIPGYLLTILMLSLLGPFGAIPRCLVLSYSTLQAYLPSVPFPAFIIACCLLIFALSFKRSNIMEIVGNYLTPLKLGSLILLIIFGLCFASSLPIGQHNETTVFFKGLMDGYQTMDLLGTFFICSIILEGLKKKLVGVDTEKSYPLIMATLKASCIASFLLTAIYLGFAFTAAFHSHTLDGVPAEKLVGEISNIVLGEFGGIFVSFAVTVACLTTAIALTTIFAEFLHTDLSGRRISYAWALAITLLITFGISNLNFKGIIAMLAPVLELFYPTLIVLCIVNILQKTSGFKYVKASVLVTFLLSIANFIMN